ncbi:MAG: saccharopine dehydrogenase family protein [Candidatus Eiseniibacteriota bacterium]
MKILVLGGGAQGRVIANDLARSMPGATIHVADVREPRLDPHPGLRFVEAELSDIETVARLLHRYDFGVGALPSRFGPGAMRAAIDCRRTLVDVSFAAEDALDLDDRAKRAGIAILPDCGVAPGLSHLLVGDAVQRFGAPASIEILVGAIAQDASRPYGYVVTWSLDDLLEVYTRPARFVRQGKEVSEPVLEAVEPVEIAGVGTMEAFVSDGLRTLIRTMSSVPEMAEKILRWPGHVAAIRPLVEQGRLIEEFREKCVVEPAEDLVVLVVRASWNGRSIEHVMTDRYDRATGLTAMSRTTAFTTSVVAQLVAEGGVSATGVLPLELVAREPGTVEFVLGEMRKRGVAFRSREN